MLLSKSTAPISQKEKGKVIDFLNSGTISNPINVIAKLLNEHFGWSLATGKIRAKAIIDQLLKEKVIEVDCNGKGLKSISLVRVQAPESPLNPRLVKPHIAPPPEPEVQVVITRIRRYQPRKKGTARIQRQREVVGEKAERRLYELSLKLAGVLKSRHLEFITEISVLRSGRHNPRKGKTNLQDSAGEDVTILMTLCEKGRYRKERIIYDAKNSRRSATKFNDHIRFYPGQTGALLKKAISTGRIRSDYEIADEILQDMISIQLLPVHIREDTLSTFDDIV